MVRWRSLRRWLGPVLSFDYRVTTRATTILRAGTPADDFVAFPNLRMVLISVPDDRLPLTIDGLLTQPLDWPNVSVVLCDSELDVTALKPLEAMGAATATVCQFHDMDVERLLAEGHPRALTLMRRYLEGSPLRLVEVDPGAKPLYLTALHLLGLTFPVLATSIELMRRAGFSTEMAIALADKTVHRTTRSAKSGKKGLSGPLAYGRLAGLDRYVDTLDTVNPKMKQFYLEAALQTLELLGMNPQLAGELREEKRPRVLAAAGD